MCSKSSPFVLHYIEHIDINNSKFVPCGLCDGSGVLSFGRQISLDTRHCRCDFQTKVNVFISKVLSSQQFEFLSGLVYEHGKRYFWYFHWTMYVIIKTFPACCFLTSLHITSLHFTQSLSTQLWMCPWAVPWVPMELFPCLFWSRSLNGNNKSHPVAVDLYHRPDVTAQHRNHHHLPRKIRSNSTALLELIIASTWDMMTMSLHIQHI